LSGAKDAQVQPYSPDGTSVPSWGGHVAVTCRITLNHPSTAVMRLLANYFDHLLSLDTPTYTVAQTAKRFEPSTVLWAFHTMQPSSFVFCLYGYGFLSGGKKTGVKFCQTGLLPFWRSKVKVTRDKHLAAKTQRACVRMVCFRCNRDAAAAADERISWRPRGDGVQRCSLGIWNYVRGSAGIRIWGRRR